MGDRELDDAQELLIGAVAERDIQDESAALEKKYDTPFPEPPVDGSETIRPITSMHDLVAEGRVMRNCVSSYHAAVMAGKSYIYSVFMPQRATLEIVPHEGSWRIQQLKLRRNHRPEERTWWHAQGWLSGQLVRKKFGHGSIEGKLAQRDAGVRTTT